MGKAGIPRLAGALGSGGSRWVLRFCVDIDT